MIPRIQTGTSFKGAGLYYLHDKKREGERERFTTRRVAWTYAINTLEDDPEQVLAEMRQTAFDQPLLKQLSGHRVDGRPTERSVMTVALAWPPEQSVTKEHMIETGHSFLQRMGWEGHQVLFVAHNDTKHPHVHLIINRVHPETGLTLDDAWSKTRAQRWALGYEREQGHIYCEAREKKYGRGKGRDATHMNYREWRAWQEIAKENVFDPEFRQALEAGEWSALKGGQAQERAAFWKETGQMRKDLRAALREDVRQEFAGEWQAYALHKAERMEKARAYDQEARRAVKQLHRLHGAKAGPRVRKDDVRSRVKEQDARTVWIGTSAVQSLQQVREHQKAYHAQLREELADIRADISSRQKARLEELAAPALQKFGEDRLQFYKAGVLARHRDERAALSHDQGEGKRRPDVLPGHTPTQAVPLTAEQAAAYVAHARTMSARQTEFDQARAHVTDADRGRAKEPGRDLPDSKPGKELTQRETEKREKDAALAAKREAGVEWYLAKRKHDRERDRGGGRDR